MSEHHRMLFTAFLLNHKLSINYKQPPSLDFTSYTPFLRGGRVYYVHTPVKTPECKIHATAGHWPISGHFSKMANQISFTLYTWSIKFLKNRKNGQPFQISYFALWSNSNPYLVATHPSHATAVLTQLQSVLTLSHQLYPYGTI